MIENTLDPAHFAAAHHNTLGNRYADPRPYRFKHTRNDHSGGFALTGDFGDLEFVPPCLTIFRPDNHQMPFNGSLAIGTYCVPTAPGKVRPLAVVAHDPRRQGQGGTLAERALAVFMSPWTPAWLGHVLSSVVLHQDAGLLFFQSLNLREKLQQQNLEYHDVAFTPTSADLGVVAFRRWLRNYGQGGIPWPATAPPPPTRGLETDIFDMWQAHTVNCRYCLDAYRNIALATNLALASAGAAVLFLPEGPPRVGTALVALATAAALDFLKGLFTRYEFYHHQNH